MSEVSTQKTNQILKGYFNTQDGRDIIASQMVRYLRRSAWSEEVSFFLHEEKETSDGPYRTFQKTGEALFWDLVHTQDFKHAFDEWVWFLRKSLKSLEENFFLTFLQEIDATDLSKEMSRKKRTLYHTFVPEPELAGLEEHMENFYQREYPIRGFYLGLVDAHPMQCRHVNTRYLCGDQFLYYRDIPIRSYSGKGAFAFEQDAGYYTTSLEIVLKEDRVEWKAQWQMRAAQDSIFKLR